MSRYSVCIVGYGKLPHSACFEDFAKALVGALKSLGHEVVPHTDRKPGRLIMLGANNIDDSAGVMPEDAIVYNTEQVAILDPKSQINLDTYRNRIVWDYSVANAARLRKHGMQRVVMCPLGYDPSMERFEQLAEVDKDIDVVFAGSVSPRREKVLSAIALSGLKLSRLFGVYGPERDTVLARAKVVLNWHYYERGIFEIFRVSHLVANRSCVVSEAAGTDTQLDYLCSQLSWATDEDHVVEACRTLVEQVDRRRALIATAYHNFKQTSLAENVRRALEES